MQTIIPVSLILVAMVSIQSGASLAKHLFPALGATGTTTLRIGFAALMLIALWRPWRQKLSLSELRSVGFYGASLGFMNILFYLSLERIPLGLSVALEFTGPLTVALLASRRPTDFIWAGLAALGIALMLPLGQLNSGLDPVGVVYALGAGVGWAFYILYGQKAGSSLHGGVVTSLGMTAGAILILPVGAFSAGTRLFDPSLLPIALAVAVFSSALPYSLEMIALKKLSAQSFGILMSLEPAIATLIGFLFLGERLTSLQIIAVACIMIASCGSITRLPARSIEVPT